MEYTKFGTVMVITVFTISLMSIMDIAPIVYSDSDNNHDINLEQNIELNEKCKNGIYGDPKGSVASTITGTCSQHAENNVYNLK